MIDPNIIQSLNLNEANFDKSGHPVNVHGMSDFIISVSAQSLEQAIQDTEKMAKFTPNGQKIIQ